METHEQRILYKCVTCLRCSETQETCHERLMVRCELGEPGDESTQPVQSSDGRILTHAPSWWVQTVMDNARQAGGRLRESITRSRG